VDKGGLRSDGRSFNYFKLSRRWEQYGKSGFIEEDWKSFKPRMTGRFRPTPNEERHSFNKGNSERFKTTLSKIEAVAEFRQVINSLFEDSSIYSHG
jgi:hypothetical protein